MTATAATNMTDAETRAFLTKLRERDRRIDAGLPPSRPRGDPASRSKRKPLGLRPADGPDDDASPAPRAATRTPHPGVPAMYDDLLDLTIEVGEVAGTMDEAFGRIKDKFDRMQASVDNAVGKLQNENRALRLILENLRITQRGERGIDGDRGPPGRDGRDGAPGALGPRGERGEKGLPGPRPVAFAVDDAAFSATMVMSDGGTGPILHLRGMFETYNEQVDASDASAAADADRAQRTQIELEVTRQRAGLPAR